MALEKSIAYVNMKGETVRGIYDSKPCQRYIDEYSLDVRSILLSEEQMLLFKGNTHDLKALQDQVQLMINTNIFKIDSAA